MEIALGIVQKENQFLLVERLKKEGDLLWAFPGGKKELFDPSIEETVIREVFEETGIICKIRQHLGQRNSGIRINYYLCDYQLGKLIPQLGEIKQCNWYSSNEIYNLVTSEIFPPVKQYLNQFL